MKNLTKKNGITLVALVVTIIILLILAGISIVQLTGRGLLAKTQSAKTENNKKQAIETINLKITNIQISAYAEKNQLPSLQYLSNKLCEDDEMEYVLTSSKKNASLEKIETVGAKSIFTKLKAYSYEFEINSSLQLEAIDGIKIAKTPTGEIQFKPCTISVSDRGLISVSGIDNMISFSVIKDNKCIDTVKETTYQLTGKVGETMRAYIIAIDENANLYKSNEIEYTGKICLLYNEGQVSPIAGNLVFKVGVSNSVSYNTNDNKIYMYGASISGNSNAGYMLVRTENLIDVGSYSKLCVRLDSTSTGNAKNFCGSVGIINDGNSYRGVSTSKTITNNDGNSIIYEYEIPKVTTKYYPYVAVANGHSGTYSKINIYQIWLE